MFYWLFKTPPFDKNMIEGRSKRIITEPILDTKLLFQFQLIPLLQTLAETKQEFRRILSEIGTSKTDRDNGQPSSSLANVARGLKIKAENGHDAVADCMTVMEALNRSINILTEHQLVNIERYQKICRSGKK